MCPGFTAIDNDCVIDRLAELDGSAVKVLLVLARHANGDGQCWPSQSTIGAKAGLRERATRSAINRLVEMGLVAIERQAGKPTVYIITPAPSCRPTPEGPAPSCRSPRRNDAGTPAPSCRSPRRRRAAEQEQSNNTQEQDPLNKTKARGKAAAVVEIPEALGGDVFAEAWGRWIQHRKEKRESLTPSTARAQLRTMAKMGVVRSVAMIDHSIEKGWTGLFEPKEGSNGHAGKRNGFPRGPGQRHGETAGTPGVF